MVQGPTTGPATAVSKPARTIPSRPDGSLRAGIGFKPHYFPAVFDHLDRLDFVEVHAENYMVDGGSMPAMLRALGDRTDLSIHGVGLSLGGGDPLDIDHLDRLKRLEETYRPALFSEHLAWSRQDGIYLNDLLPVPYTMASLRHIADRVSQFQDHIGRPVLIENPSVYLTHAENTISEGDFLSALVRQTGCGLLLDVNNVFVSAVNLGLDAARLLDSLPLESTGEIHLAGFSRETLPDGSPLLIDTHGAPVDEAVWSLYERALARCPDVPVLIEWDTDPPPLEILLHEVDDARRRAATVRSARRANPGAAA
ncbi:DUF692 domain-containing protein [Rhodospirillaceae bacterium KN72]|uniref:UPF0276 protein HH303_19490 n=1 Tax=Pacificispira spongiicola TaxID=2729598 RepID=A0A7Y0E3W1_9PROT|nr:DUF692 domain-containing protein [Pacificispira spongiicola]NMM46683.1 DUF692 domain-containing protein [Pacificispira spongiicola]